MNRGRAVGLVLLATVWPVLGQGEPIESPETAVNSDQQPDGKPGVARKESVKVQAGKPAASQRVMIARPNGRW